MRGKLVECPFCNGKAKVMYREAEFVGWRGDYTKVKKFYAYVSCNRCHARGPLVRSGMIDGLGQYDRGFAKAMEPYTKQAVFSWNRRVDDE